MLNVKVKFLCAAADISGPALQSAAKSKEESLSVQGVCLCIEQSRESSRSAFNLQWTIRCITFISGFSATHTCSDGHVSLPRPAGSGIIRPIMLYQHTPGRLQTKTADILQTLHILDDI